MLPRSLRSVLLFLCACCMHGSGHYNVRNTGALDTVVRFYFSFSTWWWLLAVNLDQNLHRRLNYLRSMPHQNAALPSKQRQRLSPPCMTTFWNTHNLVHICNSPPSPFPFSHLYFLWNSCPFPCVTVLKLSSEFFCFIHWGWQLYSCRNVWFYQIFMTSETKSIYCNVSP